MGPRRRWLVDGMNVIGSRPDGWWRDRPRAMRALVAQLEALGAASGEALTVVLDGRAFDVPEAERVDVVFAPGPGQGAADDEIARLVAADERPAELCVVTSDAELAERVATAGAAVVGAGSFRSELERVGGR